MPSGGRIPGLRLDPSQPAPAGHDVVQLGVRDRLRIPPDLVRELDWIRSTKTGICQALAILDTPGQLILKSWEEYSPAVLARRRLLLAENDFEEIGLLEDRYRRIGISQDLRMTLGHSIFVHLGLSLEPMQFVYVFRVGDALKILSAARRNAQLDAESGRFADLP